MQTSKVLNLPARQVAQDRSPAATLPRVEAFLSIQAAVVSRERFVEGATAFAAELAAEFKLERACVGMVDGDSVDVVALSHRGDAEENASRLRSVGDAMREAIEQAVTISYPSAP